MAESRLNEFLNKLLICPITQEIMQDPVINFVGSTYERKALEQWRATNRNSRKDPLTGQVLSSAELQMRLISNNIVKSLIAELKEFNKNNAHHLADEKKATPSQSVTPLRQPIAPEEHKNGQGYASIAMRLASPVVQQHQNNYRASNSINVPEQKRDRFFNQPVRQPASIPVMTVQERLDREFLLAVSANDISRVSILLHRGANKNATDPITGATGLIMTVRYSLDTMFYILCNEHVNLNARDHSGNTALHIALLLRNERWKSLILKGADYRIANNAGYTAENLVDRADRALFNILTGRNNNHHMFRPLHMSHSEASLSWERSLRNYPSPQQRPRQRG